MTAKSSLPRSATAMTNSLLFCLALAIVVSPAANAANAGGGRPKVLDLSCVARGDPDRAVAWFNVVRAVGNETTDDDKEFTYEINLACVTTATAAEEEPFLAATFVSNRSVSVLSSAPSTKSPGVCSPGSCVTIPTSTW